MPELSIWAQRMLLFKLCWPGLSSKLGGDDGYCQVLVGDGVHPTMLLQYSSGAKS